MFISTKKERLIRELAMHFVNTNSTVRDVADYFGIPKTTAHSYLCRVLPKIDVNLSIQVRELLSSNLKARHIRGGLATKKKYSQKNLA